MAGKKPKKKAGDPEAAEKVKASPKGSPKAAAPPPEPEPGSNGDAEGDGDGSAKHEAKPRKKSSKKGPKGKPVVIVESPAKAKTINKILVSGYVVKACMGHALGLPERRDRLPRAGP